MKETPLTPAELAHAIAKADAPTQEAAKKLAARLTLVLTADAARRIKNVKEDWKTSTGKTHYLRYLAGKKLTRGQAIAAKCSECSNGYPDGKKDCLVPACPLYPWMPFRGEK